MPRVPVYLQMYYVIGNIFLALVVGLALGLLFQQPFLGIQLALTVRTKRQAFMAATNPLEEMSDGTVDEYTGGAKKEPACYDNTSFRRFTPPPVYKSRTSTIPESRFWLPWSSLKHGRQTWNADLPWLTRAKLVWFCYSMRVELINLLWGMNMLHSHFPQSICNFFLLRNFVTQAQTDLFYFSMHREVQRKQIMYTYPFRKRVAQAHAWYNWQTVTFR